MNRATFQDTPADAASHIVLDGVSLSIDGRPILREVSLDLRARRVGVVGRNGSGKSTLSRLLCGLIEPSAGRVRINGVDVFKDRKAALREVGILFQNPDHQIIFPTVLEEIAFGPSQQGLKRAAAEALARETLATFAKEGWADTAVTTLSQGQKHLVCLMAVAAMKPRLLILDEPFAGLDIPTKAQLRRYLGLYSGCLVHVSHDPADLSDCDEVLWLEKGRIETVGDTGPVLSAYLEAMTAQGEGDDISDLAG